MGFWTARSSGVMNRFFDIIGLVSPPVATARRTGRQGCGKAKPKSMYTQSRVSNDFQMLLLLVPPKEQRTFSDRDIDGSE
jgi:hypothetical protein